MKVWTAADGGPGGLMVTDPKRVDSLFTVFPEVLAVVHQGIMQSGMLVATTKRGETLWKVVDDVTVVLWCWLLAPVDRLVLCRGDWCC